MQIINEFGVTSTTSEAVVEATALDLREQGDVEWTTEEVSIALASSHFSSGELAALRCRDSEEVACLFAEEVHALL